jgi:hypothetical protein
MSTAVARSKPTTTVVSYALDEASPEQLLAVANEQRGHSNREVDDSLDQLAKQAHNRIKELPERIAPEDAVRYVVRFDVRENHFAEAALLERFKLGVIARRVSEQARVGDSAMERIGTATGVAVTTVRQCRRLAEQYDSNIILFARYLKAYRARKGFPARWYVIEKHIGTFSDPTVIGAEALAERVSRSVERAGEEVAQAAGHSLDEEHRITITEAARSLRQEGLNRLAETAVELDESTTEDIPRDEHFMRFVSKLPCCATGEMPPVDGWSVERQAVDPHHTGTGGTGIKGSDYTCVPLSRPAHDFLHQHGVRVFEKEYGVKLAVEMFQVLHVYITGVRAHLPSTITTP